MEGHLVEDVAHYYLDEIFMQAKEAVRPDTMILGCTHFPLLKRALENVVGSSVTVVDPAQTVALSVQTCLQEHQLLQSALRRGKYHFMTTDNPERFARTGTLFLGQPLTPDMVELIDL